MGREPVAPLSEPPRSSPAELGQGLSPAALLAGIVACGVPFAQGIASGWTPGRAIAYTIFALLYLLLTQINKVPLGIVRTLQHHVPTYLAAAGVLGLLLQSISGDPLVQPIVFTVPLVRAALCYGPVGTTGVAVFYLLLLALGLRLSGMRDAEALLIPVATYGALMFFMYNATRLSVNQAAARRRADHLAADLARERDYLQRLVEITATLTRDLDLVTVLEQVASDGRTLAHAGQARVWLREDETDEHKGGLRLAAAVPPQATLTEPRMLAGPGAAASGGTLSVQLLARGIRIGVLELCDRASEPFTAEDAQLLQPFANAAAVAIENARLYEQARLSATLAERNRLARELHDTIAQGLTAVTMQLEAAQRSFERDPARTRARLGRAYELARGTLEDVRRSVWTLASPLVDGLALSAALDELTSRFAARTGLPASYHHAGPAPNLGHAAATQVLRIVQEALQNVEKHARATEVHVGSETGDSELCVWVQDNGLGFDPGEPRLNTAGNGFGLPSLRERARLAGGTLHIDSAPGVGTRVSIRIPSVKRDA